MFVQVVARIATILQSVTLLNGFSFEKCDADHTLKSGLKKAVKPAYVARVVSFQAATVKRKHCHPR